MPLAAKTFAKDLGVQGRMTKFFRGPIFGLSLLHNIDVHIPEFDLKNDHYGLLDGIGSVVIA